MEGIDPEYWDPQLLHKWYFEIYDTAYRNAKNDCNVPKKEINLHEFSEEEIREGEDNYQIKMVYNKTALDQNELIDRSCDRDAKVEALQEKLRAG